MEIHFQQQQPFDQHKCLIPIPVNKTSKFKGRNRTNGNNSRYVGVRQRPSGRWVAEIKDTTQKIRMWLGTFETAEEAARAYDEAACLLRGSNTRTNFAATHVSPDSPLASRINNLLNKRKTNAKILSNDDSSPMITTTANNPPRNASNNTTCSPTTSSSTASDSSVDDSMVSFDQKAPRDRNLFDDAYKPDLSNCTSEESETKKGSISVNQLGLSSWGGLQSQVFDHRFLFSTAKYNQLFDLPKIDTACNLPESADQMEFSEFERMKVERQISASLYAMNGVQEYMETVCDPIEALWDLPPLCSLLC